MKTIKHMTISVCCAALLSACGPEDAANTGSSLSMRVGTNSSTVSKPMGVHYAASAPLAFSDGTTTFTITEARMNVRDIRVTSDAANTVTVAGPYIMDLVTGSALPQNVVFDLPTGNYTRVDIRLDESNIEDSLLSTTDALLTNALIIKGTHNYNNVTDGTFSITVKVSEDIRFEPAAGYAVDSTKGANIALTYKVTDWLENSSAPGTMIDLTSCITAQSLMDADHHISMTEGTQCTGITESIGNLIKNNMKTKYSLN